MDALAPPKAEEQEEHTNDGAALFTSIVFAAMVERYWQRDDEPDEEEASSYSITSALVHVLKSIDGPYAFELERRGARVTAVDIQSPDFTGFNAPRTPEQGAAIAIALATLPDDGPRGGFFDDDGTVPW